MITKNTANFNGGEFIKAKFEDIVNPKPVDNRPAEEIAADVIKRCGLVVKEGIFLTFLLKSGPTHQERKKVLMMSGKRHPTLAAK